MLDAYIIEEIKRQDDERRRKEHERPRLEIEIPRRKPDDAERHDNADLPPDEDDDEGGEVIRIDLAGADA